MDDGTGILPGLPAVAGKPVHIGFDGGRLTSDAGILLLAAIEQHLGDCRSAGGLYRRPARSGPGSARACRDDPLPRSADRGGLSQSLPLAKAGGNDCDALKSDPAFKMAVVRLPESGEDLCSQPTISRLENSGFRRGRVCPARRHSNA